MTTEIRPPRVQVRETAERPTRTRYWDPRTGLWTGGLMNGASQERFYLRVKGYLLKPPGRLAIYRNPDALQDPDDPQRRARAYTPPLPTGVKTTVCDCRQNCASWEEHYKKRGLEMDHFSDEERPDARLSSDDITQVIEELGARGYKLVQMEDEVGTDDHPGEVVAGEADNGGKVREPASTSEDFFAESGKRDEGTPSDRPDPTG